MNQALEQLPQFAFPEPACCVCIKNISTKSQQGVEGNRISHLKANDVLPSEKELCILIFWLPSHLYNFQLLLNEGRLVPIMWYYIITMLMLKASYFTPSTCGCSARMKALMCQLGFRFCIRKSLSLETYLSIPCGWAQQGLGSRRAAWGACCPRQALCCSQRLGINITERARAELFPQSVHIMDVNVKMPPSEVWAPWNKTKNYWRCQLSGMLFRGGGKLHTQHQLSSASSFLIKGWPQALSSSSTGSHTQISYKVNPVHTYYNVSSFLVGGVSGWHPRRGGFVALVCADSAKGLRTRASTSPVWGLIPLFAANCLELVSDVRHGLIWRCPLHKHHVWIWSARTELKLEQV